MGRSRVFENIAAIVLFRKDDGREGVVTKRYIKSHLFGIFVI